MEDENIKSAVLSINDSQTILKIITRYYGPFLVSKETINPF